MNKFVVAEFGSEGPKGDKGDAAAVEVGTVQTLPAGSSATVENVGTSSAAVLNFGIPKGDKGDTGVAGADGQDGADGADGKSAYQQAVEGGYSGTEAQFEALLASLGNQGFIPKVFDGEQTITPKTGNSSSLILSPNNDTSRFKIEFNGTGGHILNEKKINGTWKTIPTIRLDNNSGIEIKQIKDDETAESVITVKGDSGDGVKIQTRNTTSQELVAISLKNNSFEVKNTLGNGNTQLGKIGISTNGAISLETVSTVKINGNDILTAADKGVNNGVASLGNDGKVPSAQLPDIDTLPSQAGNSGKFLTTDGTNPSWAVVNTNLPAFPAPSETVNEVSYTAAGGTSQILNKEIQSITFNAQDTGLFNAGIASGTEEMSFYIGRTSAYVPADDVLLTFNFTISNNVVSYAELLATRNGSSLGSISFITDLGNGSQFTPWDSNIGLGNGINIYWDSTNKRIVSDLNFKPASLTALGDAVDNVFVFETITQNNTLPAASSYTNKLAYVYETGTYSDIKNLIYSDGTNWNFLPGAVIQIPDERMHDTVQRVIPAYCGIALKTGQLAIPYRNKTYDADNDNTDDIYNNYTIGQMHEFCADSSDWLSRYWSAMNFGTIFNSYTNWLGQTSSEDYSYFSPDTYGCTVFNNAGQTTHTQRVQVDFGMGWPNYCYVVFGQGTNKIQLEFLNATNAKVFLNGSAVNTSSDLLLDAESKTYIANFYNYSDSSGYLVMDIKELPYNPVNKVIALSSSTATLATNTNYTATVSGSAAFTLPTPSDTSVENVINILLTVSATTNIDWRVNVNSVLSSFAAGKYEIRLRYNNSTSNWIGEVLKAEDVPNPVKLYVPFYKNVDGVITGAAEDLSNNPVSLSANNTSDNFPSYTDRTTPEGYYGTKALQMVVNNAFHWFTPSNNLSKLNLGTGDFTIMLWAKASSSGIYWEINALRVDSNNYLSIGRFVIGGTTIIDLLNYWAGITDNEWHHFCWTRSGNTWRGFIDGVLKKTATSSASVDFSSVARIAYLYYTFGTISAEIQELIVKNTCDYITDFTPPTAPYVLTDNSMADYHDPALSALAQTVSTNTYNITQLQTLVNNLSFVEFVPSLPQTGTTGKIYAVPLNETDLQGRTIIELFLWNSTSSDWYAVGAFSTNIDASTLVLKSMFEFDSGTGTLNINLVGA